MATPNHPRVENFRPLLRISDLTPNEDTIYLTKMVGGMQHTYFCLFTGFSRGMVEGQLIWTNPAHSFHETDRGKIMRARLDSCFLWGQKDEDDDDNFSRCQWFTTESQPAGGF